jgi:hypothetical protein
LYWHKPKYEEFYKSMEKNLDIPNRIAILNKVQCDCCPLRFTLPLLPASSALPSPSTFALTSLFSSLLLSRSQRMDYTEHVTEVVRSELDSKRSHFAEWYIPSPFEYRRSALCGVVM